MKSHPLSSPATRPAAEQTPDDGRPRPPAAGETTPEPSFEHGPEAEDSAQDAAEKLFAITQDLLASAKKTQRLNHELCNALKCLACWVMKAEPALRAYGADMTELEASINPANAALQAFLRGDPDHE